MLIRELISREINFLVATCKKNINFENIIRIWTYYFKIVSLKDGVSQKYVAFK